MKSYKIRTNTKKRCHFHHKGLECKSRKSRETWSNRQVWPWNTKWSGVKAKRVLPREHTGHSKHPLPTAQETTLHMDITRWSILKSDWLYSLQPKMEKLYTVSKNKTRNWLWLDQPWLFFGRNDAKAGTPVLWLCHLMRRVDSLEKTLMLGGIGGRRKGDDRGWDGWMASPTRWTWIWVGSGSWWWTGRPGILQSMGLQKVGHNWAAEQYPLTGSWLVCTPKWWWQAVC